MILNDEYVAWYYAEGGAPNTTGETKALKTEFLNWLNEERAKVWSEGYAAGQDSIYTSTNEWPNPDIRNPYRKVEE